jgi:hypothetical protein
MLLQPAVLSGAADVAAAVAACAVLVLVVLVVVSHRQESTVAAGVEVRSVAACEPDGAVTVGCC